MFKLLTKKTLGEHLDDHRRAKTLHEMMQQERVMGFLWNTRHVRRLRPDLTDDQAWSVLQHIDASKSTKFGITWDTISWAAYDLFPRN